MSQPIHDRFYLVGESRTGEPHEVYLAKKTALTSNAGDTEIFRTAEGAEMARMHFSYSKLGHPEYRWRVERLTR